jgi:hypothetical protein
VNHRVFISYAGAQQAYANDVCRRLEAAEIRCWIAPRDIPAGSDWVERIPAAVKHAELVLVFLSTEAVVSHWVGRELDYAIATKRPVLPVVLGDTQPSERLHFLFGAIQHSRMPAQPAAEDTNRLVTQVCSLVQDKQRVLEFVSSAEPTDAPPPVDPFVHRVSTARPAYFVLLVDHSGSMNRRVEAGTVRVRDAVADVVNEFLHRLLQSSRKTDGYRDYFDVSVLGYGLGETGQEVLSRLPDGEDRMAIGSLYGRWSRIAESERVQRLEDGGTTTVTVRRPIWVESKPGRGRTVMAEAFRRAGDLVESWIVEHTDSLPPVVLNISDGGWTGEDPMSAVRTLQEQATSLGPTLVFNCQLSAAGTMPRQPGRPLLFPSEVPKGYDHRTTELFLLSSALPESMRQEARARGLPVGDDARGLVFNAPVSRLVDFLQVGTRTQV